MENIKIFLTNLGKYNEGELVGEWVELPVDDDFEQAFKDIGISDKPDANGQIYEEYFITDYEAPAGVKIDEYDNIYELNELAEQLEDITEDDDVAEAIFEYTGDLQETLDILESGDYSVWWCDTLNGDLAREIVTEVGLPSNPEYYFDYEAFGRDLRLDGYYDSLIDDYRSQGDDEWADELEERVENTSDYELGEEFVDGMGGVDQLGEDTLERYFDYDMFERDLKMEGNFQAFDGGYVELY